jgi:protein required for attachment to host cells
MSESTRTWVVVADAHGARIFQYVYKVDPWKQVHHLKPDGTGAEAAADFGKKASEHKGALHGHGEVTAKETQERHLAHEIAHALERGQADNDFGSVALVAAPKLLGVLRENLSRSLQARVVAELAKDFTHLETADIAERLRPELPPF